jgi:cobalt-zinc-cadmium efflux system membrane fusion protein
MSTRIVARVVFNALVIAALVGVGIWGHHNGWKLPKFSALNGTEANDKKDWCEAHSVPEAICVECHESLMPRAPVHGWCEEHGVHECPLCHPEVAQLQEPYRVTPEDLDRAKRALATPRPENNEDDKDHERRIQFASEAAFRKLGVVPDSVVRAEDFKRTIRETIAVYGEISHDYTRVAHLSSRAAGSVARVFKHLGDPVAEHDVLALVEASEVGKAKDQFAHAVLQMDVKRKDRERLSDSSPPATIAEKDAAIRDADLRFRAARQMLINLGLPRSPADFQAIAEESARRASEAELAQRLHFLGIPDNLRADLNPERHSNNLLPLRASIRGVVAAHHVVAGEVVDTSHTLFELVDASVVFLMLQVPAGDVSKVEINKSKVVFRPDGLGREIGGTITWISTDADPKTRTVRVRAEIENKDGRLRANTVGTGSIVLREEPKAIIVPSSAVHWEGDCHVVFVRDKDWFKEGSYKVFHTRVVRVGVRGDSFTEIIAGVLPGEVVATKGSEVLRAELLKGKLGAGCCAHD